MSTMGHKPFRVNEIYPFIIPNHSVQPSISMQNFKKIHLRVFKLGSGNEELTGECTDIAKNKHLCS